MEEILERSLFFSIRVEMSLIAERRQPRTSALSVLLNLKKFILSGKVTVPGKFPGHTLCGNLGFKMHLGLSRYLNITKI